MIYEVIIALIIGVLYFPLFGAFFAQDELFFFGIANEVKGFGVFRYFVPHTTHYIPFTEIFSFLFYRLFGLEARYYFFLAICGHIVLALIFYRILRLLSISKKNSLITSLMFGLNSSIHQGVTWPLVSINIFGSSLLGLFSILFFIRAVKTKKNRLYLVSSSILFLSLFFKESVIGMFLFLIVLLFIFDKRRKPILFYLVSLFFYILFRIYLLINSKDVPLPIESQSVFEILYNFLTFPPKIFFQTIIPNNFISYFHPEVRNWQFDALFMVAFVVLIFYIYKLYRSNKRLGYLNLVLIFLFFGIVNSPIYAFSPERVGLITFVDSRNLYFPAFGYLSFFMLFVSCVVKNKKTFIFFIILYFSLHILFLEKQLIEQSHIGSLRKNILEEILAIYPDLPEKTVFLMLSDKSHYGLPDEIKIPPFQSGFGHTLLVFYEPYENFPSSFFEHDFLWPIDSQGYKKEGERGFGYFRNYGDMLTFIKDSSLDDGNVIAFAYKSDEKRVYDITENIRERIKADIDNID